MRISDWSSDVCSSDLHISHNGSRTSPLPSHPIGRICGNFTGTRDSGLGTSGFGRCATPLAALATPSTASRLRGALPRHFTATRFARSGLRKRVKLLLRKDRKRNTHANRGDLSIQPPQNEKERRDEPGGGKEDGSK